MRNNGSRLVALLTVCGSLLVLPSIASAQTFCVHTNVGCNGTPAANLKAALVSAANNGAATRDTIQLPAGRFQDGPAVDPAGNPVDIVGAGRYATYLQSTGKDEIVLSVLEPTSTVKGIGVEITGTGAETGIKLAGKLDDVGVTAFNTQIDCTAIWVVGANTSIANSVVQLSNYSGQNPWAVGVFVDFGGAIAISDSYVIAEKGVEVVGGSASIERSTVRAQRAIEAITDSYVSLRSSVVWTPANLPSPNPEVALSAHGAGTNIIDALQTTIFGGGSGTAIVQAPDPGQASLVELTDSVVASYQTVAQTPAGATLNTIWSAYNFGGISGAGAHNHANDIDLTGVSPKFRSGFGGQFSLRHDSPLIDAGDPNAGTSGAFDRENRERMRDGDGDGNARVDIGAHEYQHVAPAVTADGTPGVADPGQLVAFTATATDADKGDDVALLWSFDDGTLTSGDSVQHAFATPGGHTATVTATDSSGLKTAVNVHIDVTGAADPAAPGAPAANAPAAAPAVPPAAATPLLEGLRLSPVRFRARGTHPGGSSQQAKVGSKLSFSLSQAAVVKVVIQRRKAGHWVAVATIKAKRAAGRRSIAISGRAHRRALAPGRYRLRVSARTGAGVASPARAIAFKIVR